VTAGSVNFDERSFRINDEANMNVLDPSFAGQLIKTFEADKAKCKPLTEKNYKRRNFFGKMSDDFFGLFRFEL